MRSRLFYATCNSQPTKRRTTLVSDYVTATEQVRHFLAPLVLTLITSSHPLHHHMCFYPPFLEVSLPSYDTHHFDHHTAARRLCRSLIPPPRNYAAETTSKQGPAGVAEDPSSKENLIFLSISISLSVSSFLICSFCRLLAI